MINFKFPLKPQQKTNITQYEEFGFSYLTQKITIPPILTTSLIHFSLKGRENVLCEPGKERANYHYPKSLNSVQAQKSTFGFLLFFWLIHQEYRSSCAFYLLPPAATRLFREANGHGSSVGPIDSLPVHGQHTNQRMERASMHYLELSTIIGNAMDGTEMDGHQNISAKLAALVRSRTIG